MQTTLKRVIRDPRTWAIVLTVATTAGAAHMSVMRAAAQTTPKTTVEALAETSTTRAAEANAKRLLKASSDYMAAQQAFSFDYDTYLEVVTKENQKLGLASSGTMTVNRPDKIRATRSGGFSDIEFVFDGKTATMLGKNAKAYAQVDAPGTIDQLVDVFRTKYHRPIPGADLLMSNIYDQLMPEVVDTKDLGSGVIGGVECDHLAFRTKEVDWQIWIAQGERSYPCRYVITSTQVTRAPQYTVDLRAWKAGAQASAYRFTFIAPTGVRKLNPGELRDFDELPGIFAIKNVQGGR
jgi:hypothetical protein